MTVMTLSTRSLGLCGAVLVGALASTGCDLFLTQAPRPAVPISPPVRDVVTLVEESVSQELYVAVDSMEAAEEILRSDRMERIDAALAFFERDDNGRTQNPKAAVFYLRRGEVYRTSAHVIDDLQSLVSDEAGRLDRQAERRPLEPKEEAFRRALHDTSATYKALGNALFLRASSDFRDFASRAPTWFIRVEGQSPQPQVSLWAPRSQQLFEVDRDEIRVRIDVQEPLPLLARVAPGATTPCACERERSEATQSHRCQDKAEQFLMTEGLAAKHLAFQAFAAVCPRHMMVGLLRPLVDLTFHLHQQRLAKPLAVGE